MLMVYKDYEGCKMKLDFLNDKVDQGFKNMTYASRNQSKYLSSLIIERRILDIIRYLQWAVVRRSAVVGFSWGGWRCSEGEG